MEVARLLPLRRKKKKSHDWKKNLPLGITWQMQPKRLPPDRLKHIQKADKVSFCCMSLLRDRERRKTVSLD